MRISHHQLYQTRTQSGLSRRELAELSGIAIGTITRIENRSSKYHVQQTVAKAIADTLQTPVSVIFHEDELSHLGRPAKTGCPLSDEIAVSQPICKKCNIEYPLTLICGICEAPYDGR